MTDSEDHWYIPETGGKNIARIARKTSEPHIIAVVYLVLSEWTCSHAKTDTETHVVYSMIRIIDLIDVGNGLKRL